jgi:arylsulfatase A
VGAPLDGASLVSVIKSAEAASPHEILHWQIRSSWALRSGDWKLLINPIDTTERAPGKQIIGPFLINLSHDPAKRENFAPSHADIVARLKGLRADWEARPGVAPLQ